MISSQLGTSRTFAPRASPALLHRCILSSKNAKSNVKRQLNGPLPSHPLRPLRSLRVAAADSDPVLDIPVLSDPRFSGAKVLVAGATGGVGSEVVKKLISLGVPTVGLVRDLDKGKRLGPSVELVKGDVYQPASLAKAFQGVTHLVIATGCRPTADPTGPFRIDYQGTANLVAAAKNAGVKGVVFVTSIGADDFFFPLNAFWGVLIWKKAGELELQRSGIRYTIVRPGGLMDSLRAGQERGNIVMEGPDAFGLPPRKQPGSILRYQVADVMVEALVEEAAANKVVEIVAEPSAPSKTLAELFAAV